MPTIEWMNWKVDILDDTNPETLGALSAGQVKVSSLHYWARIVEGEIDVRTMGETPETVNRVYTMAALQAVQHHHQVAFSPLLTAD